MPLRYTGQYLDAVGGESLYALRARHYSVRLGRFLQPDPIGVAGGLNLYAYVGNDPLNLTDPSGLAACLPCITGLIGGTGAAVGAAIAGADLPEVALAFVAGAAVGSGLSALQATTAAGAGFAAVGASANGAMAASELTVGAISAGLGDILTQVANVSIGKQGSVDPLRTATSVAAGSGSSLPAMVRAIPKFPGQPIAAAAFFRLQTTNFNPGTFEVAGHAFESAMIGIATTAASVGLSSSGWLQPDGGGAQSSRATGTSK